MRFTAILKFIAKLLLKTSVQNSGLGFRSWAWAIEIGFSISLASAEENLRHSFYFVPPSKKNTKSISETYNNGTKIIFVNVQKAYESEETNTKQTYDMIFVNINGHGHGSTCCRFHFYFLPLSCCECDFHRVIPNWLRMCLHEVLRRLERKKEN